VKDRSGLGGGWWELISSYRRIAYGGPEPWGSRLAAEDEKECGRRRLDVQNRNRDSRVAARERLEVHELCYVLRAGKVRLNHVLVKRSLMRQKNPRLTIQTCPATLIIVRQAGAQYSAVPYLAQYTHDTLSAGSSSTWMSFISRICPPVDDVLIVLQCMQRLEKLTLN
jgi:hypothetical protein